jgi:tRNA pseudouridine38-40 synthase
MTLALSPREVDEKMSGEADMPGGKLTRFALVIEYSGERYAGSQVQNGLPTIQAELEKALLALTGEEIRVNLAGRTDAGVHARGQVVGFNTISALPEKTFVSGLNHFLPADISVKTAKRVGLAFDPRRQAIKREYEYFILNSDTRSAMRHGRAYQLAGDIDIEAMNETCALLVGEHDFASFASSVEDAEMSTVRHMYEASVRREGDLVVVRLMANAFLPHQVRNTVGALLKVGQGKMTQQEFQGIINLREFGLAGPPAPACGLYLNKVYYGNNLEEGF